MLFILLTSEDKKKMLAHPCNFIGDYESNLLQNPKEYQVVYM
jgi:hypothetical protein